eukprot:c16549_g1_i2.p1 GENE.c16549_g1_i2~~c16549_g1_i2.p1  ORF type:complete len:188 (+),score=95.27 c16549_g1_i2:33-566(+)
MFIFVYFVATIILSINAQLFATNYPQGQNENNPTTNIATIDSMFGKLLEIAESKGLVDTTESKIDTTSGTTMAMGANKGTMGTRPVITLGSDGKPVENPLITFFNQMTGNPGTTTLPALGAIPMFFTALAPLFLSRGLFIPEKPEYFTPYEPRPGAWRDPYPFVLPSTTPDNMTPPL